MVISEFTKPNNLEEAYHALVQGKQSVIIGGGAWMKLTLKNVDTVISLEKLSLNQIETRDGTIEIGAMTTLREIEINPAIQHLCDGILSQACHSIMGINVRNIATIGGSVMGRLAFSDLYPVLLTLNAELVFYKTGSISLEDFLSNPKRDKDILVKIVIPNQTGRGFFKKVATTALDFAILNIAVVKNDQGFHISLGSTPYMASLAHESMKSLNAMGKASVEEIEGIADMVVEELKFSDNIRGSKEYRLELAKTYVRRGLRKVMEHVN